MKYKTNSSKKLGHRIVRAWGNKWLEELSDEGDYTQNDLDTYKGYNEHERDAFKKIRKTTDYETAEYAEGKGKEQEQDQTEKGKKFPAYPL